MNIVGIICEYNPFHNGHQKQFRMIKEQLGDNTAIVCLMSGNYVQRGAPAIFDKMLRAEAAVRCGADLVLELPVTAALSSAENFASVGVRILSECCDKLCFGSESGNTEALLHTAQRLLSDDFTQALKIELQKGISFPAARQAALHALGVDGSLLTLPNNILAVEYCKAILSQNSKLEPMPILRQGDYHSTVPDTDNPSATAIREEISSNNAWFPYIPQEAHDVFIGAEAHVISAGEAAILAKLRSMLDAEFEALPYGSEGLWRKLMHAARQKATLSDIIDATKSKRYTRTRLDRMIMCAFLGITQQTLQQSAPYTRVLAFNDTGRTILKSLKSTANFVNIGENQPDAYQLLENRCGDLYGLFAANGPEPPGREQRNRVIYTRGTHSG